MQVTSKLYFVPLNNFKILKDRYFLFFQKFVVHKRNARLKATQNNKKNVYVLLNVRFMLVLSSIWRQVSAEASFMNSSVIRQKGESQNGCFKKTKHVKFSKKRTFLTPDMNTYVCVSGGKKCSFFWKFGVLSFLETPVLRFALLPYYRRIYSNSFLILCRWK